MPKGKTKGLKMVSSKALVMAAMGFSVAAVTPSVGADIVTASGDHYTLRQEATSTLTPMALWDRLVVPASWWHPEHTYSGRSENLSLELTVGGLWREDWAGGNVLHGEVTHIVPGKKLQMIATFGPLKDIAVAVIWTIDITPHEGGSKVVFTEIANGTSASKLDELAPAVDYVKTEAINRLVR